MTETNDKIGPNFFVSSALKDIIGRELVSNKYIAVFELVKNSYDASAMEAHIIFDHTDLEKGEVERILIYDNGSGMTKEDIMNKWLFIGYSKKKEPDPNLSRMPSGFKGIGRFSCDRLGAELDMYTKTEEDENWNHLAVNWGAFEQNQDKRLEEIKLSLDEEKDPEVVRQYLSNLGSGTLLLITKVRDEWPYKDLFSIRKYLQRMVNPYEPIADFRLILEAPAYLKEDREQEKINTEKEKAPDEIYEQWTPKGPVGGEIKNAVIGEVKARSSWIRGTIENGRVTIELYEGKNLLIETKEVSPFKSIGLPEKAEKIEAEVFFLNRNSKNIFTRLMGVRPLDFGSIHVYRNAFRVLPYGEAGNDWLQLDLRRTQGWRRFLSTRDIMGRVSITDRTNTFKEVASREGFYEGKPLTDLKDFLIDFLLRKLERYVIEAINWDTDGSVTDTEARKLEMVKLVDYIAGKPENFISINVGKNLLSLVKEKEVQKVPQLVESLESFSNLIPSEEKQEYIEDQIRSLKRGVRELNKNLRQKEKEVLFLEKAPNLRGPVSDMLNHELVIAGDDVLPSLEKVIQGLSKLDGMHDYLDSLHSARISVEKMIKIAEISLSAKFDLSTEIMEGNVISYIVQYLSKTKKDFLESNGLSVSFIGEDAKLQREFKYLEIAIIIDNLVSNSVKAHSKKILVKFSLESQTLHFRYSDDGDGISDVVEKQLFIPGFSTRKGKGLGLYTMRRIASEMKGDIRFLGNAFDGMLRGACFEVKF